MAEVGAGLKPCTFCGESIRENAVKCRHCGSWLDGRAQGKTSTAAAGPASRAPGGGRARWDGAKLTFPKSFRFPRDRCLICGTDDGRVLRRWAKEWVWASPLVWLALFAPGGIFAVLIVYLIFRKKAHLDLTECESCQSSRKTAAVGSVVALIGGLFGLPILFGVVGNEMNPRDGGPLGALLGIVAWIVMVFIVQLAWVARTTPACKRIDENEVTLQFPNPDRTRRALAGGPGDDEA